MIPQFNTQGRGIINRISLRGFVSFKSHPKRKFINEIHIYSEEKALGISCTYEGHRRQWQLRTYTSSTSGVRRHGHTSITIHMRRIWTFIHNKSCVLQSILIHTFHLKKLYINVCNYPQMIDLESLLMNRNEVPRDQCWNTEIHTPPRVLMAYTTVLY